jgi:hypothetical protein
MTRSFRHWTPRYLWNRLKDKHFRQTHPNLPWFSPQSIVFLQDYLLSTDMGLEFGAGRSTLWFAQKVKHLTSVEHNREWVEKVNSMLQARALTNVDVIFQPRLDGTPLDIANSGYVAVTRQFSAESLDFVSIDGIYRAECALNSLHLLKHSGLLIIDNVNKYLPSASKAPNSRSFKEGPADATWEEVWKQLHLWRSYWTGNGVSDTALFFKP